METSPRAWRLARIEASLAAARARRATRARVKRFGAATPRTASPILINARLADAETLRRSLSPNPRPSSSSPPPSSVRNPHSPSSSHRRTFQSRSASKRRRSDLVAASARAAPNPSRYDARARSAAARPYRASRCTSTRNQSLWRWYQHAMKLSSSARHKSAAPRFDCASARNASAAFARAGAFSGESSSSTRRSRGTRQHFCAVATPRGLLARALTASQKCARTLGSIVNDALDLDPARVDRSL